MAPDNSNPPQEAVEDYYEMTRQVKGDCEMEGPKRPVSVLVVAIILIVSGGLGFINVPLAFVMPEVEKVWAAMGVSLPVAITMIVVGAGITLISGIALLGGHNWGRLLYLVGVPVLTVVGWLIHGFLLSQVMGIAVYLVFLVLLTRPTASAYFRCKPSAETTQSG